MLVQTAIAAVQAFNGIGGINYLSDLCRKFEYRRYYVPILVPTLHGIGIILLPLLCYTVELFKSSFLGGCMVDCFQIISKLLLVLFTNIFEGVSYLMNYTALKLSLRSQFP